ncbi:hypothetical protein HNQ51_002430 [Inhella inkyongensis]|uniref:Uncharacterized protein n=1 Tax=Inhella inkyongensis TaxID=392593 RepID=A0A840S9B2_9BURK|nr:hypothetical protein [Inhella inkyongensis]MBB5205111.1 hypothetical protein [Inhella inkyongensis]
MNKIFTLLVFCAIAYYGYKPAIEHFDRARYSLSTVETKPFPKRAAFTLLRDTALRTCADAQKNHNVSPDKCEEIVKGRHAECVTTLNAGTPGVISQKTELKALGRTYLQCVTPYYFCKGVEIRTENEAQSHCK